MGRSWLERTPPLRAAVVCASIIALSAPSASAVRPTPVSVSSDGETVPTAHAGDTADDPAIWVNRADPARSLIVGSDKLGALETYDLAGNRVQRITDRVPFWGNVDVRGDLVAVYHDHRLRLSTRHPTRCTRSSSPGRRRPAPASTP
jgi:myo-inositol-hexaphosphate 3-phosphohydrolase